MRHNQPRGRIIDALLLAALPLFFIQLLPLHIGHDDEPLRQRMPTFLLRLMSKYEHLLMRSINFLAMNESIYRWEFSKRAMNSLGRLVMRIANGEVLTLDEAREMIGNIHEKGYTVAVGTCPCRRARNEISDELPNNTDMVFGVWAEEYLGNYPGLYRRLSGDEALGLVEDFDRHGLIHQVYGFNSREGAAFVLCNCHRDICIPLLAQKERGYQAFRKGRALARVNPEACLGLEECGVCRERCPFDARFFDGGKGEVDLDSCYGCGLCVITCKGSATTLERKEGAELIYTKHLIT
jgi:NAD-dependent dihydropyrimidine dehydrogenase PreA subunit